MKFSVLKEILTFALSYCSICLVLSGLWYGCLWYVGLRYVCLRYIGILSSTLFFSSFLFLMFISILNLLTCATFRILFLRKFHELVLWLVGLIDAKARQAKIKFERSWYFLKIWDLQYLQPNSSLKFPRIVGIYVLTGFTSQKYEKIKKNRYELIELLGYGYLRDIQVKNMKKIKKE